jgi:tetratricopeptide (TPR) repeat protein
MRKLCPSQDPSYLKAQLNLASYLEKSDQLEEALEQNKKLLELTPKDIKVHLKVKELEKRVEEKQEQQKKEVIDGLKSIGNSVLGYFGLSLDNFKM